MTNIFNGGQEIQNLDAFLQDWFNKKEIVNKELKEAMLYSLFTGGKRIRPLLFYTLAEDLQVKTEANVYFAAALECIHTYSLIHDDLPAMDNDDYRRGKLTCHKKFGEAIGILAGDGLLNESVELALKGIEALPIERKNSGIMAASFLFRASGNSGMIDGQAMDMEEGSASRDIILYKKKTGALLGAALSMAASLSTADKAIAEIFYSIGEILGVSYQLQDDRFDTIEDGVETDKEHLLQLEKDSIEYTEKVFKELDKLNLNLSNLIELIQKILDRKE